MIWIRPSPCFSFSSTGGYWLVGRCCALVLGVSWWQRLFKSRWLSAHSRQSVALCAMISSGQRLRTINSQSNFLSCFLCCLSLNPIAQVTSPSHLKPLFPSAQCNAQLTVSCQPPHSPIVRSLLPISPLLPLLTQFPSYGCHSPTHSLLSVSF